MAFRPAKQGFASEVKKMECFRFSGDMERYLGVQKCEGGERSHPAGCFRKGEVQHEA